MIPLRDFSFLIVSCALSLFSQKLGEENCSSRVDRSFSLFSRSKRVPQVD